MLPVTFTRHLPCVLRVIVTREGTPSVESRLTLPALGIEFGAFDENLYAECLKSHPEEYWISRGKGVLSSLLNDAITEAKAKLEEVQAPCTTSPMTALLDENARLRAELKELTAKFDSMFLHASGLRQ